MRPLALDLARGRVARLASAEPPAQALALEERLVSVVPQAPEEQLVEQLVRVVPRASEAPLVLAVAQQSAFE